MRQDPTTMSFLTEQDPKPVCLPVCLSEFPCLFHAPSPGLGFMKQEEWSE